MNPDAYFQTRTPVSRWRRLSREAIGEAFRSAPAGATAEQLIARIDLAYPFGERAMHPYKCWLEERKLFVAALTTKQAVLPSADEIGACEVAGDLVQLGRYEEARKLLEERAPNRLARKCPACGQPVGRNCVELASDANFMALDHPTTIIRSVTPLVVPHHARLVGHRDAGSLFGGEL